MRLDQKPKYWPHSKAILLEYSGQELSYCFAARFERSNHYRMMLTDLAE